MMKMIVLRIDMIRDEMDLGADSEAVGALVVVVVSGADVAAIGVGAGAMIVIELAMAIGVDVGAMMVTKVAMAIGVVAEVAVVSEEVAAAAAAAVLEAVSMVLGDPGADEITMDLEDRGEETMIGEVGAVLEVVLI